MALLRDGVQVDTLVHDALLIEGPKPEIVDIVESAKVTMIRASEKVLGMPIRVDAQIFRHPDRFYDKRESGMYAKAFELLDEVSKGGD